MQFDGTDWSAPRLKALLTDAALPRSSILPASTWRCLPQYLGVVPEPLYCTKIASKLARTYTDRHGLKDLCSELLGVELSKQQQSSDWAAEKLTDQQKHYAASDVLHLHALKAKLAAMLRAGRQDSEWPKPASASYRYGPGSISPASRTSISSPTESRRNTLARHTSLLANAGRLFGILAAGPNITQIAFSLAPNWGSVGGPCAG